MMKNIQTKVSQVQTCSCDRLLYINEVLEMLAISRSTLYKAIKEKRIPEAIKFGAASRWRKSDIQQVIKNG